MHASSASEAKIAGTRPRNRCIIRGNHDVHEHGSAGRRASLIICRVGANRRDRRPARIGGAELDTRVRLWSFRASERRRTAGVARRDARVHTFHGSFERAMRSPRNAPSLLRACHRRREAVAEYEDRARGEARPARASRAASSSRRRDRTESDECTEGRESESRDAGGGSHCAGRRPHQTSDHARPYAHHRARGDVRGAFRRVGRDPRGVGFWQVHLAGIARGAGRSTSGACGSGGEAVSLSEDAAAPSLDRGSDSCLRLPLLPALTALENVMRRWSGRGKDAGARSRDHGAWARASASPLPPPALRSRAAAVAVARAS